MKKFRKYFPLLAILLSSCNGQIKELYDPYDYNGALFTDNYYEVWNKKISDSKQSINYSVTDYQTSLSSLKTKCFEKSIYGNGIDFVEDFNSQTYFNEDKSPTPLIWSTKGTVLSDNAPIGNEIYYGATHSLSFGRNGRSEFAHGITSKLFDGRVSCSGYKALSRIQASEAGFGFELPLKLQECHYLVLALRGATDIVGGLSTSVEIDLTISFYVNDELTNQYQPYSFIIANLPITVDNRKDLENNVTYEEESQTQCISFFFDDIEGFDKNLIKNASGLSFTYELHENRKHIELVTDKKIDTNHFGLMLYELLLPNSLWK